MRIAFDHQAFTMQSYGGISRYYSFLTNELLKCSHDVKIFAGFHRNDHVKMLPKFVMKGYKLENYPPRSIKAFQVLNHCVSQYQIKCWNPEIVHETYYSNLPRLKSNHLKVTSVYDMIHELFGSQFNKRDKTTQLKRQTFDRVDHIISISHSTKKDLIDLYDIDEQKVSVVHLGVDFNAFQQTEPHENFNNLPFILYVGSRGAYKNFEGFLNACAISPRIKNKIKIVAFGGGPFNKLENSKIKEFGFKSGIIEQISGDDKMLASLYSNALCFVYPSLYEGFGLPPLEAMAAKCPVVSSNTSSMPEVVNNAGIYFDPTDYEEMSSAIEKVILNEKLRSRLIRLGLENIKLFSWQKCGRQTHEIYKAIAG